MHYSAGRVAVRRLVRNENRRRYAIKTLAGHAFRFCNTLGLFKRLREILLAGILFSRAGDDASTPRRDDIARVIARDMLPMMSRCFFAARTAIRLMLPVYAFR